MWMIDVEAGHAPDPLLLFIYRRERLNLLISFASIACFAVNPS